MDTLEALRTRRSVRSFEDRPVRREDLEAIVDCGRLAASARNEQPWEFVVVTGRDALKAVGDATDHGKFIARAGACIAVLSRPADYYLEDGSAATQNILVAAHALGLGACWVAGDRKPYAAKVAGLLGAPPECRLVSLVALGYPATVPGPVKRPLEEVLHWERY